MSSLTDAQRKMIEEKKKVAQAKLAAKLSHQSTIKPRPQIIISNNQCTLSKAVSVIPPSPNGKSICINYISSKTTKCKEYVQGTCELTSNNRFTVNVRYHQQLIETFKTIASKSYGRHCLENI